MNLYRYAENDPISQTDPYGLQATSVWGSPFGSASLSTLDLTPSRRAATPRTPMPADDYFALVEGMRARGADAPVVPGVMPITNVSQVKRFTAMCGASIPASLLARLDAAGSDNDAVQKIGVDYAAEQCRTLLEGGAPGIHFYTLNRSTATVQILERLR